MKKILLLVFGLLLFSGFGVLFGLFLTRPPVLIVTDSSFVTLYGSRRLSRLESRISRELFRRIIPVYVGENAGPNHMAIAVEDAFGSPEAVMFPFRYIEGARYYKDDHPDVPVYVMTDEDQSSREEPALSFIQTDRITDFYRAGLAAALLAGENRILVISDGVLPDEQRDAFREGLKVQGYLEEPVWGTTDSTYSSQTDLGCAVIAGLAVNFLEQHPAVPVVLFSWADPSFTPKTVKLVFDDSPWIMAAKTLKSLPPPGEGLLVSSAPTVFKDRLEEKRDFRKLKKLVKEEMKLFQN